VITQTQNVVIEDITNPAITCPADQQLNSSTFCDAELPDYTNQVTVSDNCSAVGDIAIVQNPPAGTVVTDITIVTFTATDEVGNQNSCAINVEVIDVLNPQIVICAENDIQPLDISCSHTLGDYTSSITAVDNCTSQGDIALIQTPAVGSVFSGHGTVIPVTIEAVDESGNSISCAFEVTLEDTTAPVVVCPSDQTVSADASCMFQMTDFTGLVTATDNCSATADVTLTQDPLAGEMVSGTTTVTITATDEQGNAETCEFDLIAVDTTAPIITDCAPDVTEQVDANCEFALADYTALANVTDNCSPDLIATQTPPAGTVYSGDETEIVITLNYADANGNNTDCQFTVTLEDSVLPSITCPVNQDVVTTASCEYTVEDFMVQSVAMDNCSATADITLTQAPAVGTVVFGEGAVQDVTITATDLAGNVNTCTFQITLTDTIAPEITCGEDLVVVGDAQCQYELEDYTNHMTTSDNCDTDIEVTQAPAIGTVITGHGTTQVITLTATDNSGNQTSCEFMLTLVDNTNPEIVCIENQTLDAVADCTAELPDYMPQIITSDNCIETTLAQDPLPGTILPQGETVVTMTVTDINNNTQTCSFTVEVIDVTPPSVDCLPNITVPNDTDTSGNITTCEFTVTVNDTEAPVIECPENQTLEADENCQAIIPDYTSQVELWDNCSTDFTVTQLPAPGDQVEGDQLVGITVTDEAGNSILCGFTLEVVDTTAPQIECPEDIVQISPAVFYELPQVTDNCHAELELTAGLEPGEEFEHGYTTVTYTATDSYGNSTECSFEVLINTPPVGVNDSLLMESHVDITEINVLDNDTDADGDELTLTDAWTSSDDTEVWIDEDGTIEYQVYDEWCGTDTITYELCDQYGACDQAFLVIEVECYNGIVVPEGFSPNGDGVNDELYIEGILHFPEARVHVYNRWGRAVFKATGYQNNWEGKSTDALTVGTDRLPEGTYFVYINLEDGSKPIKAYVYLKY